MFHRHERNGRHERKRQTSLVNSHPKKDSVTFFSWRPLRSWRFNLVLVLLFCTGCATTVKQVQIDEDEAKLQGLLSQAASQFAAPNPPKALTLSDEADVEWHSDKSMKVTVRQVWAARVKPDHPLPPLASLNLDSQSLTIRSLRLFDLSPSGGFTPSAVKPEAKWVAPGFDLPGSLSKISTVQLPELGDNQALEVEYSLETKTSTLLVDKDPKDKDKPHPVAAEGSFAFLWNDHVVSLARKLTMRTPKIIQLFGARLRLPKDLTTVEEDLPEGKVFRFSNSGSGDPIPMESFQPPLEDLAPLTAFTVNRSWEEALQNYRKGVKKILDGDLARVTDLLGDAGSNTALAFTDRLSEVKAALHKKVEWVDTGLPVYLNPVRTLDDILNSGKGTSSDMAILLAASLKWLKIPSQIYLYRKSTSGDLVPDLPALSQMDGVLVASPTGNSLVWMDPTEPLAVAGALPLNALGEQALGVLAPLIWKTTPPFGARDHRKERDITMEFLPGNLLRCTVDLKAYGSCDLSLRQFFRMTTEESRRDLVLKGLSKRFPGVSLTDYRYGDYRNLSEPLNVKYTFEIPGYATPEKGGFSFYPIVFEDVDDFLATLRKTRQTPVLVPQNFNSVSRVLVKLPAGFKPGDLPKDGTVTNPVAEFIANSKLQFGTITYERYLGIKRREIAPGKEYSQLQDFYQGVLTQDRVPFKAIKGK